MGRRRRRPEAELLRQRLAPFALGRPLVRFGRGFDAVGGPRRRMNEPGGGGVASRIAPARKDVGPVALVDRPRPCRRRRDRGDRRRDRLVDGGADAGDVARRLLEERRHGSVPLGLDEVLVVLGAPLLRGEDVVREGDPVEERLDLQLVRSEALPEVFVGVKLGRERVVSALDLLLVRRLVDAEDLVVGEQFEPIERVEDPLLLFALDVDLLVELGRIVERRRLRSALGDAAPERDARGVGLGDARRRRWPRRARDGPLRGRRAKPRAPAPSPRKSTTPI